VHKSLNEVDVMLAPDFKKSQSFVVQTLGTHLINNSTSRIRNSAQGESGVEFSFGFFFACITTVT